MGAVVSLDYRVIDSVGHVLFRSNLRQTAIDFWKGTPSGTRFQEVVRQKNGRGVWQDLVDFKVDPCPRCGARVGHSDRCDLAQCGEAS
jgi:hypothetical protein